MKGENAVRTAVVEFGEAAEGNRLVAGVTLAGRIVHDLAGEGFVDAWLVLKTGEALGARAAEDVARLAGPMEVHVMALEKMPALSEREVRVYPAVPNAAEILKATGKPGDGLVSRWLNRPISRRISMLLLAFPAARPIHATFGTALFGLAMATALIAGGAPGLIAGGILFHAASVFDGVDGEMARATFRSSSAGAALDTGIDAVTNLAFILGVTINLAQHQGAIAIALGAWGLGLVTIGLAGIAVRVRSQPGPFRFDLLKHEYRERASSPVGQALIAFLVTVSSRDFFALAFAILILAGFPLAVLCVFAFAATVWIMFVAALLLPRRLAPSQ